jgi:hypothetical protein
LAEERTRRQRKAAGQTGRVSASDVAADEDEDEDEDEIEEGIL